MNFAGIDVSKASLHVGVLGSEWTGTVPNTPAGHARLVRKLEELGTDWRIVVEATATYSAGITRLLAGTEGMQVMLANPRATHNFAKALNQRGKTDALDCLMLARYAAAMPFTPWKAPPAPAFTLRRVIRRRRQVVRQHAAEKKVLAETRAEVDPDPFVLEDIEANLATLAARIKRIEAHALDLVRKHQELRAWHAQLLTIPGVADVTALRLMAELGCLDLQLDARQLTAYAGLDPQPHQSGAMDARRRISKRGNKRLRTTLYLAAWNTTRFSPEVAAWRQRLIDRGKPPKVADVAVARRLLHAIVAMRRKNAPWSGSAFHPGGADA